MAKADEFVKKALSYEGSTDGNYFIREYNKYTGKGIPLGSHWCAMFVTVIARQCGIATTEIPNYEGCITGERLFRALNRWKDKAGYTPKTGDIVIFDWDKQNNNGNDHTGIVTEVKGGRVYTIEGNAGNNGKCLRRDYSLDSSTIVGYGTPIFTQEEKDLTKAETEALAKQLIDSAVKPLQTKLTAAEAEIATLKKTYKYIEDVPQWYRKEVQYYIDQGILKGKGEKDGKVILDLTATECRLLTIMYRQSMSLDRGM